MTLKILPRIELAAKPMFVLARYFLVYVAGYSEIDADDGSGSAVFGELLTGTAGSVLTDEPNIFRDATASFLVTMVGDYIVTSGSSFGANNNVWQIVAVPDSNTLILGQRPYGPRFVSDQNISWRIFDPTVFGAADGFTVLEAPNPAGTFPNWQIHLFNDIADTTQIQWEVGPIGGWNAAGHVWGTASITPARQWLQDPATPVWYLLADTTHMYGWTEDTAGTAVFDGFMAGSAQTFRTSSDPSFALSAGGLPDATVTGMLNAMDGLAVDNTTPVQFTALKPASTFVASPADNLFVDLENSLFDLRRDIADIPVCSEAATTPPELRGVLRSHHYTTNLVPYKKFVDNGRALVSLGLGICVDWDGSLVV